MTAGSYRWWVVAMLWLVCFFNYADRQAIFSVFPRLESEMELSKFQLGIVGGAFGWFYAAALPVAGVVGDRVSRKLLILGGLAFWSFVTLATAWSQNYWQLVLFRALEGLGEAFYFPASMSLISDYHGPATRSRAMSLHQSSVYAGTIAGGFIAGYCAEQPYLAERFNWRFGFYLFGTLGLFLAVVLLLFLREPARERAEQAPASWREGLRNVAPILATPMVLVLIAVFVGANFIAAILLSWLPSFLHEKFTMSLTLSGLNATLWLQVASVLGVLYGGWLADRWARRWRAGRMVVQALGLFAAAPFMFLVGWTEVIPVLLVVLAGLGFFKGVYDSNIWASLYEVVRPERRATALGLMNATGWFGGGMAPPVIAVLAGHYGMSAALSATSAIYVLFGMLLVVGVATFIGGERVVARTALPAEEVKS
jgi:MFS family permease